MPRQLALEICAESVYHALAAEYGGAQRVELCSDLPSGGITPSAGLMQTVRRHVDVPIHVLIRPRAGNFCYTHHELEIMRDDIQAAKRLGMDGIVLGSLHEDTRINIEQTKSLVELAHPLPVTFHRAFDASANLEMSLEEIIQTGASRILTSGGKARAVDALSTLARLVEVARERILLMPCGGIDSGNIVRIARATLAHEFHISVRGYCSNATGRDGIDQRDPADPHIRPSLFEEQVAKLASLLASVSNAG
jgi:copper homeostasis protein